jgi:hypothetical protein
MSSLLTKFFRQVGQQYKHSTTRILLSTTTYSYPSAFTTVGQLLRSSQGFQQNSSGPQSAMVWIFRTCDQEDLDQIMNGTVARRIDRFPPFNRSPNPLPLLMQIFRLLKKSPKSYEQALNVLSQERIHELSLTSKCALIKALQLSGGKTVLSEFENDVVTCVLKSVRGDDLTIFKNMLNDVGTRYNLHQLIFQTLTEPWREQILSHFENQAGNIKRGARDKEGNGKPIKVLSDIDDTLFSSWLDKRWPREIVYPGVRTFFVEITRNNNGDNISNDNSPGNNQKCVNEILSMIKKVEILIEECRKESLSTASTSSRTKNIMEQKEEILKDEYLLVDRFRLLREKSLNVWLNDDLEKEKDVMEVTDIDFDEFSDNAIDGSDQFGTNTISTTTATTTSATSKDDHITPLEDVTYITARPHGYRGVVAALTRRRLRLAGLSEKPQILLGDLKSGLLGNKRIAEKKFTNFVEFSYLFPEYDFIVVGDSGQGDAALSELIFKHYPKRLKGVFLHNISNNEKTGDGGDKVYYTNKMDFHFFQTYIGSANFAYESNLLNDNGLVNVCLSTFDEFCSKKFPNNSKGNQQKHDRLMDLHVDMKRAIQILKK